MDATKLARLVGMVVFTAVVLLIIWYWRVGYWEIVDVRRVAPSGYGSIALTLLKPSRLTTDTQTNLWFMTQPLVLVGAWLLRAKLGVVVDKLYRAL